MSNIGKPCVRQLWLEKNFPDEKEPLTSSAILKFIYGDLIEELVLFLVELAGHSVEGRQSESEIAGIKGHKDAVIDGTIGDVKSASSFSFKKFKEGLTKETDSFGYITQLTSYLEDAQDDPLVTNKDEAFFLVVDKQNGHITLDTHKRDPEIDFEKAYEERKAVVNGDIIPDRAFQPQPDGYKNKNKEFIPNGNEKLPINCSYCPVKFKCHDNIRVFLRSTGPVFMTKVVKEPTIPEITDLYKQGKEIEIEENTEEAS